MSPRVKTNLQRGAALLGVLVLTGGVYMFASNGTSYRSDLIAQAPSEVLPLVDVANGNVNAAGAGTETVSTIFDATPTTPASTGTTMTGSTMTGAAIPEVTSTAITNVTDEVTALESLRPAATDQATNLLGVLGFSNENTNVSNRNANTALVANAVTTTSPLELGFNNNSNKNANTNAVDAAAKTALTNAPRVPQTGPESWLLAASVLCAMMGMTMLISAPKHF